MRTPSSEVPLPTPDAASNDPAPPADLPEDATASYSPTDDRPRGIVTSADSTFGVRRYASWEVIALGREGIDPAETRAQREGGSRGDDTEIESAAAPGLSEAGSPGTAITVGLSATEADPDRTPAAIIPNLSGLFSEEPSTHDDMPAVPSGEVAPSASNGAASTAPLYELARPIARGGMGEVWEAHQSALGRRIAVKRIRQDVLERNESAEARADIEWDFRQEAVATARLEHPNIVPIYDLGRGPDGLPMLAMKLVRGKPWDELIREDRKALSRPDFYARHVPILLDVAQAIAFAHASGIIHRDIKPAQVMIGQFGETLLMDWGLAIAIGDDGDAADDAPRAELASLLPTPATATNPAGTPALMAPEQTESSAVRIGIRTDIYLLGGTLYYLLTGRYPHQASNSRAALNHARHHDVERPRRGKQGGEAPQELIELAMKSLERDPADRPQSVGEFVHGLEDFLSGAGRRHEAEAIVSEVRTAVTQLGSADASDTSRGHSESTGNLARYAPATYKRLAELHSSLGRARALWPDHPGLKPLNDVVLEHHARLALRYGDLRLARLQSEQIETDVTRAKLLERVAGAEQEADQAVRTQRRLRVAVTLALVAMAIGAAVFAVIIWNKNQSLDEQRIVAEKQSEYAQSQWNRAERHRLEARMALQEAEESAAYASKQAIGSADLIHFLLDDLSDQLDLRSERDIQLRDNVSERVMSFLSNDPIPPGPGLKFERAVSDRLSYAIDLRNLGRYKDARAVSQQAYDALGEQSGVPEMLRLRATIVYGGMLVDGGEVQEGVDLLEAVLPEARELLMDTELSVLLRRDLISAYLSTGELDKAEEMLEEAIALTNSSPDPDPRALGSFHNSYGIIKLEKGEFAEAERYLRLALEHHESREEKDMKSLAAVHSMLGRALGELSRFEEGSAELYLAIELAQGEYGLAHPELATMYNNLALQLERLARHEEALEIQRDVVGIYAAMLGENHQYVAIAHSNMANTLQELDRFDEALESFDIALKIFADSLGEDHPYYGIYLNNKANALRKMGRPEDALPLADRAHFILENSYGPDHPTSMQVFGNLGFNKALVGDYDGANEMIQSARESWERNGQTGSDHWIDTVRQQAMVARMQGDSSKARSYADEAMAASLELLGADHKSTKRLRTFIGLLDYEDGKLTEAREAFAHNFADGALPIDPLLRDDVESAWQALQSTESTNDAAATSGGAD